MQAPVYPSVKAPLTDDMLRELASGGKMIIVPGKKKRQALRALEGRRESPRSLAIFTGPEGGISPGEMEKLKQCRGVCPVTLGPRILRAETAPLAVLSIIMYLWGDMG